MTMVVLIAETNDLLRTGLRTIFSNDTRVKQIYEVKAQSELQLCISTRQYDLVIVNADLITDISLLPQGRFVILASELDVDLFQQAYRCRAKAYLRENAPAEFFLSTLNCDEHFFLIDPYLTSKILMHISKDAELDIDDDLLTPREKEVISLLREGVDRRVILKRLCISNTTLKTHIKNIRKKKRGGESKISMERMIS